MNTLTLTLSTETRTALQAEADRENVSLERHINTILARRVARPSWPDLAESAALADEVERLEGERDRARDSAVLHEASEHHLRALVTDAIERGAIIASSSFIASFAAGPIVTGGAR